MSNRKQSGSSWGLGYAGSLPLPLSIFQGGSDACHGTLGAPLFHVSLTTKSTMLQRPLLPHGVRKKPSADDNAPSPTGEI